MAMPPSDPPGAGPAPLVPVPAESGPADAGPLDVGPPASPGAGSTAAAEPAVSPDALPGPLLRAARAGDAAGVVAALASGARPGERSAVGWTALHGAARGGHLEVARLLIAAAAPADARAMDGLTPLMLAAEGGHAELVAALRAAGATPGLRGGEGRTAVESALQLGHVEVADRLRTSGAAVDAALALLWVRALLQRRGQPVALLPRESGGGLCTPGPLPTPAELSPIAAQLLEVGPDLLRFAGGQRLARVAALPDPAAAEGLPTPGWRYRQGWTPLVEAALHGELPPDEPDLRGLLPTLEAIRHRAPVALAGLLALGADPRAVPRYGCMRGATLLHNAADQGDAASLRLLLAAGAPVDPRTRSGWTPLLIAAARGHEDAVVELIQAGADLEARSPQGGTALALAQARGAAGAARRLLVATNRSEPGGEPQAPKAPGAG